MVVVTRQVAIRLRPSLTVALVTSIGRGHPAEVPIGPERGLAHDCVINCDDLHTVPLAHLGRRRGSLGPEELRRLDAALRIALELD